MSKGLIPADVRTPVVTVGLSIAGIGGMALMVVSALSNDTFNPYHPVLHGLIALHLTVGAAALWRRGPMALRAGLLVGYCTVFSGTLLAYLGPTVESSFLMLTCIMLAGLLFGRRMMALMVLLQLALIAWVARLWLIGVLPPADTQKIRTPAELVFWPQWGLSFLFGSATLCSLIFFLLKKLDSHYQEEKRMFQTLAREQQLRAQAELSRLQSEVQRRSLESEFGVLWSSTPLGLSVVKDRKFVRVNQRMTEILGYTEAEFVGRPTEFVYRDHAEFVRVGQELRSGLEARGFMSVEAEGRRKDGQALFFLLTATPLVPDRLEEGYVVTCMDISHVKRIEQARVELERAKHEAEAASRAKSAFLANMSHEIRTPLNAILGFTQLLMRDTGMPDTQREQLRIIDRNGEHLLSLINDILEISKIEANRTPINLSAVDVIGVCRDLEDTFRLKASAKQIGWRVSCVGPLPQWVQTDSSKLRMVLINLVGNAIKFTSKGEATLEVSVVAGGEGGRLLRFDVRDTGPGISAEDLKQLFQTFMQTETGRQAGGTGLGLAISRQYARMLGGEITVESVVGRGSLFRLEIPLEEILFATKPDAGAASAALGAEVGTRETDSDWAPAPEWVADVRSACAEADIGRLNQLLARGTAPEHERVARMREALMAFNYLQVERHL
ncbi:PAS domain-containing sensor histidine kinase [Nibricoccus sp. IMCC34717]|uniref:sensor histidine kinase n=1 Tax=Nibricoccus sp. IMCC34717 TaxID=3034021 RepID=UPI00384D6AF1